MTVVKKAMELSVFHDTNILLIMCDNAKKRCTIYESIPAAEIVRLISTEEYERSSIYSNNDVRISAIFLVSSFWSPHSQSATTTPIQPIYSAFERRLGRRQASATNTSA